MHKEEFTAGRVVFMFVLLTLLVTTPSARVQDSGREAGDVDDVSSKLKS